MAKTATSQRASLTAKTAAGSAAKATPGNPAKAASATNASTLEQAIRTRIESLAYLPSTVGVAMKFVELGKDPEADPADYSKVISSDASLSTKLLALANSSWFGVRNRVTKPQVAVNLLGLGTVRTLAISYCLTGLNNELKLSAEESRTFWAASLCKAVAARQYVSRINPKLAEEAFAAGLFEDFALPVMYSVAKEPIMQLVQDASLNWSGHLEKERALCRLDHAELARSIAQKLELPDLFIDAVSFHHNLKSLREFVEQRPLADAVYVASLFPHCLGAWNKEDGLELQRFLAETSADTPLDTTEFLNAVEKEFASLYAYFEPNAAPELRLADLMATACRENADAATHLVGSVHQLLQQAASAGREVHNLLKQQNQLEAAAHHDPLTGAINRQALTTQGTEILAKAARYGYGVALAYMDLDHFKQINDTAGHRAGDTALRAVADAAKSNLRQYDLVARVGGDEFVLLIGDAKPDVAKQVIQRIIEAIAQTRIAQQPAPLSVSAGLVWCEPQTQGVTLDGLMSAADAMMYKAKRAGGNRVESGPLPKEATGQAA